MEIRVPRLGEGVSAGTVVSVLVKEGDKVKKDQTVLELETDKAVAPIPATESGTIDKILVKEGEKVSVGQAIMQLSGNGTSAGSVPVATAEPARAGKPQAGAVLTAPSQAPQAAAVPAAGYQYESKSGFAPPASPSVRKVARELGIDLARVRGSEAGGRIVIADLKAYIANLQALASAPRQETAQAASVAAPRPAAPSVDFSKWGPVTRKPLSNLRRTIGERMVDSWTSIPHVTQFDEADISGVMELRKKYNPAYEKKGGRLTVTSFILKVVARALKKYAILNASLDEAAGEIVYKDYCHLGVAVDTESGLIVPVIRDVDKKSLFELSKELAQMAEKTRQRKISVDELQGGTFNISNLGSIGGTHFTPIVTKPQLAVLGVGRGVLKPVIKEGKTAAALMLPLALSYDHRLIDGADGARFIRELVGGLENFPEAELKLKDKEK